MKNPVCLPGGKIVSEQEFEDVLFETALRKGRENGELGKKFNKNSVGDKEYRKTINYKEVSELKNYLRCPFYEYAQPNANCRSSGVGEWISGSEHTRYYCTWYYTKCFRYMKAKGIEDEEYKRLNEEYSRQLFGEDHNGPGQKFLIKQRGEDKDNGGRKFKAGRISTLAEFRLHPVKGPCEVSRG